MIQKGAWHFNMPTKVKKILTILKEKAETKSCVDVEDVQDLMKDLSWNNLPTVIDNALELLGVDTERSDRTLPKWLEIPSRVKLLTTLVSNLDCRSMTSTADDSVEDENISSITLVEFAADEDLTGENLATNITVYFEDKSGDEIPNIGKKLFLDREMTIPLVDKKGAFYFIRPSQPDEKVTMMVRGTGTVKKTKFEV